MVIKKQKNQKRPPKAPGNSPREGKIIKTEKNIRTKKTWIKITKTEKRRRKIKEKGGVISTKEERRLMEKKKGKQVA